VAIRESRSLTLRESIRGTPPSECDEGLMPAPRVYNKYHGDAPPTLRQRADQENGPTPFRVPSLSSSSEAYSLVLEEPVV
jgi:hypothetical protein